MNDPIAMGAFAIVAVALAFAARAAYRERANRWFRRASLLLIASWYIAFVAWLLGAAPAWSLGLLALIWIALPAAAAKLNSRRLTVTQRLYADFHAIAETVKRRDLSAREVAMTLRRADQLDKYRDAQTGEWIGLVQDDEFETGHDDGRIHQRSRQRARPESSRWVTASSWGVTVRRLSHCNRTKRVQGATTTTFSYDRADQLYQQVIGGTTMTFAYDRYGNLTTAWDKS